MSLTFNDVVKALAIVRSERKIKEPFFVIAHPDSCSDLTDWLNFIPSIRFPKPEATWHYKLRIFVRFLKELPRRVFNSLTHENEEEDW